MRVREREREIFTLCFHVYELYTECLSRSPHASLHVGLFLFFSSSSFLCPLLARALCFCMGNVPLSAFLNLFLFCFVLFPFTPSHRRSHNTRPPPLPPSPSLLNQKEVNPSRLLWPTGSSWARISPLIGWGALCRYWEGCGGVCVCVYMCVSECAALLSIFVSLTRFLSVRRCSSAALTKYVSV